MATESLVRVGCPAHNCGGRCVFTAHVVNGVITRLDADDRPDSVARPQLRGCPRGRSYLRRQYHPDRLTGPLRRVGERGEGVFEPIGWDEALDQVAAEMVRVRERYGPHALFVPYGTGSSNQLNGSHLGRRLMNLTGGHLGFYNNYSMAAINAATPTVYGTRDTGNDRQDWLNSRYVLMWGWNPAEMRDDTNTEYFLRLARDAGAKLVCVDPRMTLSAVIADEWVPIRPGTDAALMSAMAYTIVTEGLHDREFVRTHCVGFDAATMPAGADDQESWTDYLLGVRDGQPKTPEWAEPITGVPAATTARIAREYATAGPAILYQGYGMQRRAYGEQAVRAGCALAAITGNVGIPGGWASGSGYPPGGGSQGRWIPIGENPVRTEIPVFAWTDAITRGIEMGPEDGLRGGDHLDSNIKLIYAIASNTLVNQHADINRTTAILRDTSLVEFIVVQDQFLTASARFADIVLPACTQFETWGLEDGWKFLEDIILQPKVVEPLGESRSDYRICAGLAGRLGVGEEFTEGRDERAWVEWMLDRIREERFPHMPTLDEMLERGIGVVGRDIVEPRVAFVDFRADPVAHPLGTPSGKIEIYSAALAALGKPDTVPAVPRYIQEWESPFGPEAERFPFSVIGHHTMHRVHSTHDNVDWLEEAFPQRVHVSRLDAQALGISDGDVVRVANDRGTLESPCRVTDRLMPGVVDVPQGAWWTPGPDGVDQRGAVNVLTSWRATPYAFGNAQHTIMARLDRVGPAPVHPDGPRARRNPSPGPDPEARGAGAVRASRSAGPVADGPIAFHFDASACTGCKACQVACKDRNGLPAGTLWRRVYEVTEGSWSRGDPPTHDVTAYNLSISCNHCERPVCLEVCPAQAITRRPDGIVLIDPDRCTGCGYCSWACPYGAPQLDTERGVMTKCTFCVEDLTRGKPPACVAACPMRALDLGTTETLLTRHPRASAEASGLDPLPDVALTRPSLLLTPHRAAGRGGEPTVANAEEVWP